MAPQETPPAAIPEVDPYVLLAEWLSWWRDTPEAPAKMPGALHVRTSMALVAHAHARGDLHQAIDGILPHKRPDQGQGGESKEAGGG